MPLWAAIYLTLFLVLAIIAGAVEQKRALAHVEIGSAVAAGLVFAGCWVKSIYEVLGYAAPVLLVLSIAWELLSAPRDFRELRQDPDLSPARRSLVMVLTFLFVTPLYVLAALGVFRHFAK